MTWWNWISKKWRRAGIDVSGKGLKNSNDILKLAKKMTLDLVEKTEGPGEAMLVTFQIQEILRSLSIKNLELLKSSERIAEKTEQRQTNYKKGAKP